MSGYGTVPQPFNCVMCQRISPSSGVASSGWKWPPSAALAAQDVTIHTQTKVSAVKATKKAITLTCEGMYSGDLSVGAVIQSVGRRSKGPQVKPENAGIAMDERGIIAVDASCRTNQDGTKPWQDQTDHWSLSKLRRCRGDNVYRVNLHLSISLQ